MLHSLVVLLLLLPLLINAAEPAVIPVGLDTFRQWERWPYQRIGARTYMRSTYDRRGGNQGADASHFLYQQAEDRNVTLDLEGPGLLCFTRYNHWHGSPWHYTVDGHEYLVQESSTGDPLKPVGDSVFLPAPGFPQPLAWTWSATKGADLSWVPIPFERSFRLAYSRTHYGTGYYIYQQYVPGAKLSQPLRAWNEVAPSKDVLELIARSGTDLVPTAGTRAGKRAWIQERVGELSISGRQQITFLVITNAPSMLRALDFAMPREQALAFGHARLRITWDDAAHPSVEAPIALFFGAGTLYNRDNRQFLVKAFPINIRFDAQAVHLACYFPMPFFQSARFELLNPEDSPLRVRWAVRYQPYFDPPWQVAYFHATYRDHGEPAPGQDLVLLDTRQTEGGGDWSGHLIGTSIIFSDRAVLNTLEGDPRFFFDDSQTPQAQGTGTEEWCGGGDYWGGENMTLPFAGHPTGARNANAARNEEDKLESAYRFLLSDLMPFGKNALIRLEHGGMNESTEHYRTLTYWYGVNRPALVQTDQLRIGDPVSEREHAYSSPLATPPYGITSRYEWGVDTLDGSEIYPPQTDVGRRTTGTTQFDLRVRADNCGVLLRRKLDYQFPNQRALVSVAPVKNGQVTGPFRPCGTWYLAGSSTCVYSNPKDELGPAQHIVETSNRRFRDDEFLLDRRLTRGHTAIRVRIQFTPVAIPLFPGYPLPELAWTELRYDAYCFVLP